MELTWFFFGFLLASVLDYVIIRYRLRSSVKRHSVEEVNAYISSLDEPPVEKGEEGA
jgi:hypothetical protein